MSKIEDTINEIEALHRRTTKGPWTHRFEDFGLHKQQGCIDAPFWAAFCKVYTHVSGEATQEGSINTAFIAAAHEVIPRLIAEIRRLEFARDQALSALADVKNYLED